MKLPSPLFVAALAILCLSGCKPKPQVRVSTDFEKKEAANAASDAQFGLTIHDLPRAEQSLDQATKFAPDVGSYWVELGATRARIGDKTKARAAYEGALLAFQAAYLRNPNDAASRLQEVYVLTLLGQVDDARDTLAKHQKALPEDREIKAFVDNKQIDKIVANPAYKEIAL